MVIKFVDDAPVPVALPKKPAKPVLKTEPAKRAPAGSFDRKAYQRELMRKRRAAAKEVPS